MNIQKLKLHNFKGFEDIEIDFHPQMTVIVGANGAGKTSIIEGAAIAASSMFSKMDGLVSLKIDKSQAHLKIFSIGSTQDVQPQFPVEITAEMQTVTKNMEWKRSLNSPTGKTTIIDAKAIIDLGISFQKHLRNGDASLVLPIIAYYGTGRLWDYHREKQNDVFKTNNRLNGYVDCVDGTANVKLMMNWFAKMTVQKYQNNELGMGEIPELIAVYTAMETCYKRITGCDDVKIQYNMGTKELDVVYLEESDKWMRIPINQLSDGYKSTISLVADIAYRMAVLNPQLLGDVCEKTDGIVMIDEVDLHLHPAWQQRILGDLCEIFPKVQFIVTTHAPAVINTVERQHIRILRDMKVEYAPTETYGKDTNSVLKTIMYARERPLAILNEFKKFYHALDNKEFKAAEDILDTLEDTIGEDPDTVAMRVQLDMEQL